MTDRSPVLVSACLAGVCCRYDGASCVCEDLSRLANGRTVVPLCPEQLAGLPTPRPASHLRGGDGRLVLSGEATLLDDHARDVTASFLAGAQEALRIARLTDAATAILKDGSPSCGSTYVTVDGEKAPGMGVAAAALAQAGLQIITS